MRIALIIEHFDASRGGAEAFTVWLAAQLAERGHDVHVICHDVSSRINRYRAATQRASHDADRSHAAHSIEQAIPEGVHIHTLRGFKLSTGIGFRLFGRRTRAACRRLKPDIIHSMTVAYAGDIYHPHAGIYASIQAQAIASRSTSAGAHFKRLMLAFSSKQRTLMALERRALRPHSSGGGVRISGPRRIISLSPMMTRELADLYSVTGEQICELPNPRLLRGVVTDPSSAANAATEDADRAWFRQLYRLDPLDRVAIFVGHDFRRKGLRSAIETISRTQSPWKLVIVGLGKAREYVEFAESLRLLGPSAPTPRIIFVGPTREIDRIYPACDALLLPTYYDSFGLVVLEAMAHGLPAFSTEHLGAAYIVKQHQAGTIVPTPRDVTLMAAALNALPARGTPQQLALSSRARQASRGMPPDTYLQKLLDLYQAVATENR